MRTSKYQSIFQHIRDKILNGDIPANTYLPSESELQQQFNACLLYTSDAADEL